MKPYKLVCITGPDGSGKSTLIKSLQERLPSSVVVTIWDILKTSTLTSHMVFKSPADVDNYLSQVSNQSRFLLLMHCLSEALEMAKQKNNEWIFVDSYWYKYYATELAHGAEQKTLDGIAAVFEKPDLLFTIQANELLTSERKKNYTRYECGFAKQPNADNFIVFQKKANGYLQQLIKTIPHIELAGMNTVEQNCEIALERLKSTHP